MPSEGHEVPKWMTEGVIIDGFISKKNDVSVKGGDGFSVSPGQDPNTQGILIWDKPFFLHGEDGVDRCLLIMDTQGLWDYQTSNEFNNCIFGLSSFFASYLIFNYQNSFDTERYKTFATLSMFSNGLVDHSKAFQHLDFLLRDYSDYDTDMDGIPEAIKYSTKELNKLQNSKIVEEEMTVIESCFEQFDVFCLPSPGEINGRGYKGSIAAIRHMFFRILGFYIDKVITTIQPRRFNGEELTVDAFVKYKWE